MTEVGAAAPGGSSAPSGRGRRDHGFSVIEVVVSVLIMGIIAVPLLDSLWGAVRASSSANETAMVQTALQDAADRVNRAPLSCSYASYVPGANPTVAGTWSAGACAGAQPDPGTLQMVVVTVRSPRLGVTRSVEVFKSGF
jgi:prepilin-type N-terminal cleavage/methylation domain-containing protein